MGGRHVQRRLSVRSIVALLVALGLVVAAGLWFFDRERAEDDSEAAECGSADVVAAPEVAAVVRAALAQADCAGEVTEAEPAAVEQQIIAGEVPAVWVPDLSSWAPRIAARVGEEPEVAGSIASSPVLIAAAQAPTYERWSDVLLSDTTVVGNPLSDGAGALAVAGGTADATEEQADQVQGALVVRAQSGAELSALSAAERLGAVSAGQAGAAVVSEQQWRTDAASLAAGVPADGAPSLDYPVIVLAEGDQRADAASVASAVLAAADGDAVATARDDANLRDAAGAPIADGAGEVPAVEGLDTETVVAAVRTYSFLVVPLSTLAVIDVSGSMAEPVGDSTRLGVAVGAALVSLELFSDASAMGLWEFGVGIGSNGADYQELVGLAPLGDTVDGVSQRERIVAAASEIEARPGVGTGLYDTVLAAVRTVQASYDPNAINSVILITDGRNDDPGSIELSALLSTLERERDPARPVGVYAIGITAEADGNALQQIASATGGVSHVATDPGSNPDDLADLFRALLAARDD